MKVLSLFDGISCGHLALDKIGIKVDKYYASEIEPNAIAITQYNYPDTIQLGDITKITEEQLDSLGHIDMVIGGSPCQDLSCFKQSIGDNKGLEGSKSNLFYHYVRILKHVNPKYFLLENVASMEDKWRDMISEILGVEPIMIDSSLVCAAIRERYYWCNFPVNGQPQDTHTVLADIVEPVENVPDRCYYDNREYEYFGDDARIQCRLLGKGLLNNMRCVYNLNSKCATILCDGDGGNRVKKVYQGGRCRKLLPVEYERLQNLPDNYTLYGIKDGKTVTISNSKRYTACGNGWTVDVIAHIFKGLLEEIPQA